MRDVRSRWDASRPSIGANDTVQVEKSKRLNLCCGRMAVLINSRGCSQHCDSLGPRVSMRHADSSRNAE